MIRIVFALTLIHATVEPPTATRTTRSHVVEEPQEIEEPLNSVELDELLSEVEPSVEQVTSIDSSDVQKVVTISDFKQDLVAWADELELREDTVTLREDTLFQREAHLLQREVEFAAREHRRARIDAAKASLQSSLETSALAVGADGSTQPVKMEDVGVVTVAPRAPESALAGAFEHRLYGPRFPEPVGDVRAPEKSAVEKTKDDSTNDEEDVDSLNKELQDDLREEGKSEGIGGEMGVVVVELGDGREDELDLLESTIPKIVDDDVPLPSDDEVEPSPPDVPKSKQSAAPTFEPDHEPHHFVTQTNGIGDPANPSSSYLSF